MQDIMLILCTLHSFDKFRVRFLTKSFGRGKAYAQDLFTSMFQKDPVSREVGLKYQKAVLEKGASRNGMELLENFLGRKPNAVARYQELGLL
jgi:hypothetical protein